jgi:large subunit ribosomal protein L15
MKLNELKDNKGARYKSKRVGRGLGSGKGKTAGRGTKGQGSRTGVSINGFEGGQMPLHRRLPKRGFKPINRQEVQVVNLGEIEKYIKEGMLTADIDKAKLHQVGLLRNADKPTKLLAKGDFSSKINIEIDYASAKARELVESNKGKCSLLETEANAAA